MTARLKSTVNRLYQQHGLLSFLLFFVPLLPGFIEHHTFVYISLVETLTGSVIPAADPAIKKIFGNRGVKTVKSRSIQKISPFYFPDVKKACTADPSLKKCLKLVNTIFFDQRQRHHPYSDRVRTQVIEYMPELFALHPKKSHQLVRSTLIRQIAWLALTDRALEPKSAIITLFHSLLEQASATEQLRRQHRHNTELMLLETRMKGELSGRATALDPDFVQLSHSSPPHQHYLTQSDIDLMKKILVRLKEVPAPDIALKAHQSHQATRDLILQIT